MTRRLSTFLLLAVLTACRLHAHDAVWWGYWNSGLPLQPTARLSDGTTHAGVRLTAGASPLLSGSTLHGLRFHLSDKTAVRRAWLWVSATPFAGQEPQADKYQQELSLDVLRDDSHDHQPTEVLLPSPVPLLASGRYANAYVGISLVVEGSAWSPCQLMSAGPATRIEANSCLIGWQQQEASYGPLALQLLVSGPQIATTAMAATPLGEPLLLAGSEWPTSVGVRMDGSTTVTDYDVEVSIGGDVVARQHIVPDEPFSELGLTVSLPLTIALPTTPQQSPWQVTVTAVNGQPNLSPTPSASATMTLLSQWPLRRTVMEELTGTWCPNCPRGLVGMRLLEEQFADRFIGIAIHGGDSSEPMLLPDYDGSSFVRGVSSRLGGRPSAAVDRTIDCDPYGGVSSVYDFGADDVVAYLLEQPTVADLAVTAHWTDESRSRVAIDCATTFRYGASDAPYALMLTLLADSLTGEGNDWLQVNTLVGKTEYGGSHLDEFVYGERYMRLKYNHVPVWVDGVEQGIDGSIAAPIVSDATQHFTHTADIAGNTLVQDKDLLHAVALLIDRKTGRVANAAQTHIAPYDPDGIVATTLSASDGRPQWYSLDGRRLSRQPLQGLYIERRASRSRIVGR